MIAVLSLIYGAFYFLFFKKLKWFAQSVRNIAIFVGIGVVMIGAIVFAWWTFAPTAMDGRVFNYVIPIVPNVRGQVVEVPVSGTQTVSQGDVLFRIDPTPYQFTVDQLEAAVDQAEAQKRLAEIEVNRAQSLVKASAGAQSQLDQWIAQLASAEASIASLQAQLGNARWQLQETEVRAPHEGTIINLQVRPGTYVTSTPIASAMSFVSAEEAPVIASFSQSAIRRISVGDEAEMVFRNRPGKVYTGRVERIVEASGTSQMMASGQLPVMSGAPENSRWAVVIELDDQEAAQNLPQSAGASIVAVYTQWGKPVQVISRVMVRMQAWTGYLTSP